MQNGMLSGVPYLVMWLMMIVSGYLADLLRRKRIFRTTTVRKLANGIGEPSCRRFYYYYYYYYMIYIAPISRIESEALASLGGEHD